MESIGNIFSLFHSASIFVIGALIAFTFLVLFLVLKFWDKDIGQD